MRKKYFLHCILLGGTTILFFTTRLVKDLKKKNEQ